MKQDAKRIIKELGSLPKKEKKKVYDFLISDQTKKLNPREKKILDFAIKGTRKLKDWNKKAGFTLERSRRFTNSHYSINDYI